MQFDLQLCCSSLVYLKLRLKVVVGVQYCLRWAYMLLQVLKQLVKGTRSCVCLVEHKEEGELYVLKRVSM